MLRGRRENEGWHPVQQARRNGGIHDTNQNTPPLTEHRRLRRLGRSARFDVRPGGAARPHPMRRLTLRLRDEAQIGLHLLETLRIFLLRVFVGDRGRDDDVVALLPVHRRRDIVACGELQRVDHPQHLVEIAARAHRVGEDELDLLVGADDEDDAHGGVVGGGAALAAPSASAGSMS